MQGELPTFDAEQQNNQKPSSPKQDAMSHKSKQRNSHDDSGRQSPPSKRPKVVDVCINGDSFEQNTGDDLVRVSLHLYIYI